MPKRTPKPKAAAKRTRKVKPKPRSGSRKAVGPVLKSVGKSPLLRAGGVRGTLFSGVCWVCGKKVRVNFEPSKLRPVYCSTHLRQLKAGSIPVPKLVLLKSIEQRVEALVRRLRWPVVIGTAVVAIATVFVWNQFTGKAEVTRFYPEVCLGTWRGATQSEGRPETERSGEFSQFSETNSAVYDGGQKQVFCSKFEGDLPEGSRLRSVHLNLFWALSRQPLLLPDTSPEPESAPVLAPGESEAGVAEPPAEPQGNSPQEPSPALPPAEPAPEPSPVPPATEPTAPEPVSWRSLLQHAVALILGSAQAQEESVPAPEPAVDSVQPTEQPVTEPLVEPVPESPAVAEPAPAGEPLPPATGEEQVEQPPQQPLPQGQQLNIKYSFDGTTWNLLTTVDPENLASRFAVPVDSIPALSLVQIAVEAQGPDDAPAVIFLDGMGLDVEYERRGSAAEGDLSPAEIDDLPRVNIEGKDIFLTPDQNFGPSDEPIFELKVPNEPVPPQPQVVAPPEPLVVPEFIIVPDGVQQDDAVPPPSSGGEAPAPPAGEPAGGGNLPEQPAGAQQGGAGSRLLGMLEWVAGVLPAGAQAGPMRVLKSEVLDPSGSVVELAPVIESTAEGARIRLPKPERSFRPGKYQLKVEVLVGRAVVVSSQEFSWGVLAVNVNKSVFSLGEFAYLQMGSLDDQGHTLCESNLELRVTPPSGAVTIFTVADSTITKSSSCGADNVTMHPDYYTNMEVREVGTYRMLLTNRDTGYHVDSTFEVQPQLAFSIERRSATRINPFKSLYHMYLNVTAAQDFTGVVRESVPSDFIIVNPENQVTEQPDRRFITWQVDLKAGQEVRLEYVYAAPMVSPEFFLLGPAEVLSAGGEGVFTETRQWQIASDAITIGTTYNGTACATTTSCTVANVNGSTGVNRLLVAFATNEDSADADRLISGSGVTFGATGMTLGKTQDDTTNNITAHIYYLINPSGTATVTFNWAGTVTSSIVSAKMLSDVAQSSPVDITGGSNFTNQTSPSVSVSTGTDLSIVMGLLDNNVNTSCTAGSSEISNLAAGTAHRHMTQYAIKTPAGSQAMGWTGCGSTNDEALAVVAFKPFTITVSGNVYSDEVPNFINCTTPKTVRVRLNGSSTNYTGSCTGASGAYSVTGIPVDASDVLVVFIDGATENATVVTRVAATPANITDAHLYQNRLVVRHEDAGPITNTDLDTWDNGNETDGDVLSTVTSGALTVASGAKLIVWTGDTFTPGGTVTTTAASNQANPDGDVLIQASGVLSMGTNALSVGGDFSRSGTLSCTGNEQQTTTFTGTTTGFTITGSTFCDVTFNGSGGGWSFDATTNIGDLTMTAGTLSGTNNIIVGADVQGTAGVISLTGGAFEQRMATNRNFGTTSGSTAWTFATLQFSVNCASQQCYTATTQTGGSGDITVSTLFYIGKTSDGGSPVLNAGNRRWILSNANQATPFDCTHSGNTCGFTGSTSTIVYSGDNDGGDVNIDKDVTYNNLELGGAVAENYTPAAAVAVAGNLTVNANGTLTGTQNVTVNGAVSGAGTITLTGGTFEQRVAVSQDFGTSSGTNNWTFYNLTLTASAASRSINLNTGGSGTYTITNQMYITKNGDSAVTVTAGSRTVTFTGDVMFPCDMTYGGILTAQSSTFVFSGNYTGGGTEIYGTTYNHLTVGGGVAENYGFTGGGSPVINGDLTINANATLGDNLGITVKGNVTGAGTVNFTAGTFEQRVAASKTFGSSSGTNTWTFATLIFSNSNGGATPISITMNAGTGGTIVVSTLLQIGQASDTSGATTTFNNETSNDRVLDINGNVDITTRGIFNASSTQSFTVAGNWTNSNQFASGTGRVTLDGTTSVNLNSGCAQPEWNMCTSQDFYELYINKTSGTDSADNVTLTTNGVYAASHLRIVDGELIQSTLNVYATAISVDAAGKWNNVSTGDLNLSGAFTNNGTVIMNSSGGACSDADAIIIQDGLAIGDIRAWTGPGSFDMQDLFVQDMGGDASITCTGCTDNGNNDVNWTFASCGFDVSGTFFPEAESGNEPGQCDGSTQNLSLRVNTGNAVTAFCTDTTGTFTFSAVSATAGDTITIYSTGANKANRVYVSDGNADTGQDLYHNTVAVADDQDGSFTILDLLDYDSTTNDTDMLFNAVDSTPDTLTVENNVELHIHTGDTFAPGGTVTTDPSSSSSTKDGDVHIDGTGVLNMSTNALSVGGDLNNEGTLTLTASQTTTFTATSTGHVITDGGENFDSVTFNGSGGGWSFADSSTIGGTLTMTAGTLSGTQDLTVNTAAVGTGGVITLTGGTFENRVGASQNFGPTTASTVWTFNNLTFSRSAGTPTITKQSCATCSVVITGNLLVSKTGDGAGTILGAGNATWTLSNSNGADPFNTDQASGALSAATSTFVYSGDNDAGTVAVENASYYNLTLGGAVVETYSPEGNMVIGLGGTINVNANGTLSSATDITMADAAITGAGTVNMTGGSITDDIVSASKTFGSSSGSNTWTFNNLTFYNSLGGSATVASWDTGGTGGVTVAGVLTVSLAGDGDTTTLVGGNRTWTLSNPNSADPFELDGNGGAFSGSTSTVLYSGDNDIGNVTVEDASYNNIQFGGAVAENYVPEAAISASSVTVNANGTLAGTQNVTVNDGNVTGAGTINLTAGTFEQRVSNARNFGTSSGSNTWTFNNLTFSNATVSSKTVTTDSGGSGGVTITGTLLVSKSGDSAGTVLDAGSRTWTLSNSNSAKPFNLDQASGSLTASTSTFVYSGDNDAGNVTVENPTIWNSVALGGGVAENYAFEGAVALVGDLTMNANGTLVGTGNAEVSGSVTGSGTINLTGGTFTHFFDDGANTFGTTSGTNAWTFTNLTFKDGVEFAPTLTISGGGSGAINVTSTLTLVVDNNGFTLDNETNDRIIDVDGDVNIGTSTTLQASSTASFTVGGSWVNSGGFTAGTGRVTFDATATGKTLTGTLTGATGKFHNLTFDGSGGSWLPGASLQVGNDLQVTTGTFDVNTSDPTLDVDGALTIGGSGIMQASNTATFTLAGSFTNNGTFNHNSGTVTLDTTTTATLNGSATPAITFNNLSAVTGGKTINFTAAKTFRVNGALTVRGASGNQIHIHSTSSPTQWLMNHQGTESVQWAHLEDSGCDGGSTNISLDNTSTDGDGNNGSCWLFPSLSFVLSSTSASLALDEANTFTTTATTGLTITARATSGFQCYAFQTDSLRHTDTTTTIANWAGTNATPTTWTGNCINNSECGWGYSTNDADLTQFTSTKYAGFTTTGPGDVVASSTGPVTSDATTITYRASVSRVQKAGLYQTIVRYIVVPQF